MLCTILQNRSRYVGEDEVPLLNVIRLGPRLYRYNSVGGRRVESVGEERAHMIPEDREGGDEEVQLVR